MSSELPKIIDPRALSVKQAVLNGVFDAERLPRLIEAGAIMSGKIEVSLHFGCLPHERRPNLRLNVQAAATMQCERCGESFVEKLTSESIFACVNAGRTNDAEESDEIDVLEIEDGQLDLHELVIDELLLAMPLVARHSGEEECEVVMHYGEAPAEEDAAPNPFAALAQMKKH